MKVTRPDSRGALETPVKDIQSENWSMKRIGVRSNKRTLLGMFKYKHRVVDRDLYELVVRSDSEVGNNLENLDMRQDKTKRHLDDETFRISKRPKLDFNKRERLTQKAGFNAVQLKEIGKGVVEGEGCD